MALTEAEKRRRRFLKVKKEHGDVYKLQKHLETQPYTIWWDDNGEIKVITPDPKSILKSKVKGLKSAEFEKDQVEILLNSNTNLYYIETDPNIDTVHYIKVKTVESSFVKQEDNALALIEENVKSPQIKVSCKEKVFSVTATPSLLKEYKGTDTSTATAKGSKLLKFYFTSINDPSYMIHTTNIVLSDLLENKTVERILPYDLSQCSIYTIKIFDKYVRT